MAIDMTHSLPPVCAKHAEHMIISFYLRPGSPNGNGYVCRTCVKEREEAERTKKDYANSRWPEGSEI